MPATSLTPASPAMPPLTSAEISSVCSTLMPAKRAACGLIPTARMRRPKAVRLSTNHMTTMMMMARMKPRCSRERGISFGNMADAAISGDCGHCETGSRHGPLSSALTPSNATELSSSVVTTSSMASLTRISAGISTQAMPAAKPPIIISGRARSGDTPSICNPMAVAAVAPARSWPSAPMFQKPPTKANVTAAPVSSSGVDLTSTSMTLTRLESGSTRK